MAQQKDRVLVTPNGLQLGAETLPLVSGEIHYYQHDPDDWPRLLDSAKSLGLGLVSTYVPWGVHEAEGGQLDFGRRSRRLDLPAFLGRAADRGLRVILRPGPHINAELNWLGFPFRLLRRPDVMARTPRGNPVWLPVPPRPLPIPSYAAEPFLAAAEEWLGAVAEQVRGSLWPLGPVVLVQLDNEAPLLFRDGPFDQDYSAAALTAYGAFLADRGKPVAEPPRSLEAASIEELGPCLEWMDFRVHVFARAVARFRRCLEDSGVRTVAFSHNIAQGGAVPPVWPGVFESADLIGFDFYHQRHLLAQVRGRCLYAAGSTLLPWAAELGTGGPWNLPPLRGRDSSTLALAAVAYGLRGFNLFMAANRDRWYGAPIDNRGRIAGRAGERVRRLVEIFRKHEVHELRLAARVAIVVPRLYPRLSAATWSLGPVPPSVEAFGLGPAIGCGEQLLGCGQPIQVRWAEELERLCRALARAGVGYVIVDGGAAAGEPPDCDVAVLLSYEAIDRSLWNALLDAAADRLELVVGPVLPRVGEDGLGLAPLSREQEPAPEPIDSDDGCRSLAGRLAGRPGLLSAVRPAEDGVEVTVLERRGRPILVGVAELDGRGRTAARLVLDRVSALVDAETGERPRTAGREAVLALEPHQVRLFEVLEP